MAYYNRKKLLINTLKSIEKFNHDKNNLEIIIVDDASLEEERLESIQNNFKLNLKIIRIDPKNKKHLNSCIPFNIGFKEATGDIIIIQNPECYHFSDIVSFSKLLEENNYTAFSCYSLTKENNKLLESGGQINLFPRAASFDGDDGFYCHQIYRPKPYHFCSSIYKKDLDELGGFDERYAFGVGYDDDEFLHRIYLKKLKVNISNELVFHQNHYTGNQKSPKLFEINQKLFVDTTLKNSNWKVN